MTMPVLLVSQGPFGEWWRESALGRSGLEVAERQDYDSAYEALLTGYWRHFVLEHMEGDDVMPTFLWRVRVSDWTTPPRCLLLTTSDDPALFQPPVVQVVDPSHPVDAFDHYLSRFLDVPVRDCCRAAVSLPVSGSAAAGKPVSGVTVDLSTSGMLVRADRPLSVGERLAWRFGEATPLADIVIPGAVMRPRGMPGPLAPRTYPVRFDTGAARQRESIKRFLMTRLSRG
jgi:hypothetical protein